jgi:hypothetical protein
MLFVNIIVKNSVLDEEQSRFEHRNDCFGGLAGASNSRLGLK